MEFEQDLELTSDLEGMLQSGQGNLEMLADALVEAYYDSLSCLATVVFNDAKTARDSLVEIFSQAILEVYRYRSTQGADRWFFAVVLKVLRHYERGSLRHMLSRIAKNSGTRLSQTEIVAVIRWLETALRASGPGVDRSSLTAWLRARKQPGQERLEGSLAEGRRKELIGEVVRLARWRIAGRKRRTVLYEMFTLAAVFLAVTGLVWGMNTFTSMPNGIDTPANPQRTGGASTSGSQSSDAIPDDRAGPISLIYTVQAGDTLASIAEQAGSPVNWLAQLNHMQLDDSLQVGQTLLVAADLGAFDGPAPKPNFSVKRYPPLDSKSNPLAVFRRLVWNRQYWHSAWLDASVTDYGPPGYVGPPLTYRVQAWVTRPDQRLVLVGKPEGSLYYLFVDTGTDHYLRMEDFNFYAFAEMTRLLQRLPLNSILDPNQPGVSGEAGSLAILGEDEVAGRPALTVQWKAAGAGLTAELKVDRSTGAVLAMKQAAQGRAGDWVSEFEMDAAYFNIQFPPDIYSSRNLWTQRFASGPGGEQEALQAGIPTARAVPRPQSENAPAKTGSSQLSFKYPADFDITGALAEVEVLAGNSSLGRTQFGNPWTMICDRSVDGRKIAFVSQPTPLFYKDATLRWLDITRLDDPPNLLPEFAVTLLAFNPDNRTLAFYGHRSRLGPGKIYLLDTDTGEVRPLFPFAEATSLAWNPDGSLLAISGKLTTDRDAGWIVVDPSAGEIIREGQLPTGEDGDPLVWPARNWGITFPAAMGGLEACAAGRGS